MMKSVLLALPTYLMSCYKFHKGYIPQLHKAIQAFWINPSIDRGNKISWDKWEVLCLPREKGGLGMKNLVAFNQALLAKSGWKLLFQIDTLCAKILKDKYYPSSDFIHAKKR